MDLNVVADFATKTRHVACRRAKFTKSFKDVSEMTR